MRTLLFLTLLLLHACASQPAKTPVADTQQAWQSRIAQLSPMQDWSLSARIAIRTNDDGWHGSLEWQQQHSQYTIQFTAPLGQGSLQLAGHEHGAELRTDGKIFYAISAEALLQRHLGWHFPVKALRYWMVGLPFPESSSHHQLDAYGRLAKLEQDDWKIEFRRYEQVGELELPDKIFISNHRLNVRLIIQQWNHIRA